MKFGFLGVAVYYLMPLFDGYAEGVSTLLTLDSGPAQLVNLNRVGSEPTVSTVRWSASGLTSGAHTVVISLGNSARGELANWGEVDAFMYVLVLLAPVLSYPQDKTQLYDGGFVLCTLHRTETNFDQRSS